jgi:hypothetical protein
MTDYHGARDEDRDIRRDEQHAEWRARGVRLFRWLKARPAESWLFFVGGLLAGKILL